VAKINPVKVKQDADKLEKAGKLDQAIALYRQIVEDNPRDWNTINKIGDLFAKLNRNREAAEEYAKVADFYAKDGFLLKSIAIWKKINKLDPSALDPNMNLADLYGKQGLMMEAKSQYQTVVDEYIKRGKMRDAGDVLKKMADIDPADLKVRSKLADLYTRDGNTGKAVEEHVAIADELTKKGHLAEALQVLEKGLKLDPKSNRLRLELARIHFVQKNYEKAAHFLEEAVRNAPSDTQILAKLGEAYLGAKKIEEAEAIFKRLLELDPNDQESRLQMGRVHLQQGQFDDAHDQFLPVVDKLLERKEGDKAAALLQQIVQASPTHVKSLLKLVDVYRRVGKEPLAISTYSQLTEAYINQGQMAQAAEILEILVSMEPQNQQHKTKLQFVRGKLSSPTARASAPLPAAAPVSLEEEFEIPAAEEETSFDVEELSEAVSAPSSAAASSSPLARPSIETTGPLSDEDKEFIEEHLAEGKVFRKYGLVDKAADQFESVIARFPDNVEARIEMREVHKEKGQNAKAAEQSLALAEIFRLRGDTAAVEVHEAEARRLAPGAAPAKPTAAKPAAAKPAVAPKAPPPAPPPPVEEDIAIPEAEEEIPLDVEEVSSFDLGPEPVAAAPPSQQAEEELPAFDLGDEVGGDELMSQFVEDEPPVSVPIEIGMLPEEPAPASAEEALEFPLEEVEPPPPTPLRAAPARVEPAAPAARAVLPSAPGLPADLQKVLDEVDSYVSLGFVDDAKDALREVAGRYPGHPALLEKFAELGLDQETVEEAPASAPALDSIGDLGLDLEEPARTAPQVSAFDDAFGELGLSEALPEPAVEPPPELELGASALDPLDELGLPESEPAAASALAEPAGMDLGAELGELFGTQSAVEETLEETTSTDLGDAGLADIFKEFKRGVDKQLGKEDYDTRYNLGIAYKEMGLIDEAIAEFQLAAKDENRILECSSMLGICFLEKGMPKLAVKWFEKGLKAPGRSDEEYLGLRYDLAIALEASGEIDKAFGLFTELYGQDANFRDVASKVRELKAALG
jgi:tetratricopeptide (TPR) repeat protein